MATGILNGQTTWKMTRDEKGHREYKITYRVRGSITDGPANVIQTPGLPTYGAVWEVDDDVDIWAWCRWNAEVTPVVEGEPNTEWLVTFTFSTNNDDKCCKTNQVEDPLLEPMEVSGGGNKYTEEATVDRFGKPITNSALELIRGPQNEWDANRATIKIKQNVPDLQYYLCKGMEDCVNDAPIWGMPARAVKLSSFSFTRKFYGTCNVYYERNFEFETKLGGWDRSLLDEGTKALNGHHDKDTGEWVLDDINGAAPDPNNPLHFKRYKDRSGENTTVILDGHGIPYVPTDPSSGADQKWWAIGSQSVDGGVGVGNGGIDGTQAIGFVVQGTCAFAKTFAVAYASLMSGPWDTEEQATQVLNDQDFNEAFGQDPAAVVCDDNSSAPGRVNVEKYPYANFLLLNIPTVF